MLVHNAILAIQIAGYKNHFNVIFRTIVHAQILQHIEHLIVGHVIQPMGDEGALQRCVKGFFAIQTLHQVLTGISYPTGHVDKSQYFFLQILIAIQTIQCFQEDVNSLILKFIATACTDNQDIIIKGLT